MRKKAKYKEQHSGNHLLAFVRLMKLLIENEILNLFPLDLSVHISCTCHFGFGFIEFCLHFAMNCLRSFFATFSFWILDLNDGVDLGIRITLSGIPGKAISFMNIHFYFLPTISSNTHTVFLRCFFVQFVAGNFRCHILYFSYFVLVWHLRIFQRKLKTK